MIFCAFPNLSCYFARRKKVQVLWIKMLYQSLVTRHGVFGQIFLKKRRRSGFGFVWILKKMVIFVHLSKIRTSTWSSILSRGTWILDTYLSLPLSFKLTSNIGYAKNRGGTLGDSGFFILQGIKVLWRLQFLVRAFCKLKVLKYSGNCTLLLNEGIPRALRGKKLRLKNPLLLPSF